MPAKPTKSAKPATSAKSVKSTKSVKSVKTAKAAPSAKPPKPAKAKLPGRKTPAADKKIAAHAKDTVGKVTAQRFAATGRTTRVQGHVSAHNKRTQGKRDSR